MVFVPVALLLTLGSATAAVADNNVCRQHSGAWTATGSIMAVNEFGGSFMMMLDRNVPATPQGAQVKPAGECLVGTASGQTLPPACKAGSSVTITGTLNFDDQRYANVHAREIACN